MSKFLIIFVIFIIFFGFFIWQGIYLPKSVPKELGSFSVEKGQGVFQIAENLEKDGLIKSRIFFDFYVIITGNARKLRAGDYFLSPSMSTREIAKKIISGDVATIKVTIPEGWTVSQIEERLGLKLPGENLEGFLFPDTYKFPVNVNGSEVVKIMKENFEKKLTPELREEIARQGKTIEQIVIMASLLEKEVRTKEEKELAADVLWKRLGAGMPLQVDAEKWTYENLGLPPEPIANPGLESIRAAVYPKSSEYWYYLSTPDGKTIFNKTLKEHNLAKAKYLR